MFPANETVLTQYLGNKQKIWADAMRRATHNAWKSDSDLAKEYVIERGAEQLAEEFKQDETFWSLKICDFMHNSTDQAVAHAAVQAGTYVLDASVGAAADITLSALRVACASRQTQNWAAPILGVGAVLILLIAIFGTRGNNS